MSLIKLLDTLGISILLANLFFLIFTVVILLFSALAYL